MINGFQLINFIGHLKYGMATYVNQNVQPQQVITIKGNDHTFDIQIG